MEPTGAKASGFIGIFLIQITIIILYGIFVRYDSSMLPKDSTTSEKEHEQENGSYPHKYPRKY